VERMTLQRYVSQELTHFVGRGLKEEKEQYELLLHIIKSGWLKCDPQNRFGQDDDPGAGGYILNIVESVLEEDVYQPAYQPLAVCFCDIPLEDLQLHMQKYSRFDISFHKDFLIERGANPVFYIAKNSATMSDLDGPLRRISKENSSDSCRYTEN
jgi:hypothetical protein